MEAPLCAVIEQPLESLIPGKQGFVSNCFPVLEAHGVIYLFIYLKEGGKHQADNPKEQDCLRLISH